MCNCLRSDRPKEYIDAYIVAPGKSRIIKFLGCPDCREPTKYLVSKLVDNNITKMPKRTTGYVPDRSNPMRIYEDDII